MKSFISYAESLKEIIATVIHSDQLHAQWLNTLSFLENCGARKIAACQHPMLVKEEMLKHAAEEFRHAHNLKKQINKIYANCMTDYSLPRLLGGMATYHYLQALDLGTSRYLSKIESLAPDKLHQTAYLLVTYAIELRAEELYIIYDTALKSTGSKITVKAIIFEEKGHLNEMRENLKLIESGETFAEKVCAIESCICQKWVLSLQKELRR